MGILNNSSGVTLYLLGLSSRYFVQPHCLKKVCPSWVTSTVAVQRPLGSCSSGLCPQLHWWPILHLPISVYLFRRLRVHAEQFCSANGFGFRWLATHTIRVSA
jgi:hypothetical protein